MLTLGLSVAAAPLVEADVLVDVEEAEEVLGLIPPCCARTNAPSNEAWNINATSAYHRNNLLVYHMI